MGADSLALLNGEAAFRADQDGGRCWRLRLCQWRAAGFIGKDQRAASGPVLEQLFKWQWRGQFRHRRSPRLFGGLDQMGAQPIEVGLVHHGALRRHQLQPRHTKFAGLLHQPVDASLFQGRGAQPQVGHLFLVRALPFGHQRHRFLRHARHPRRPFTIPAIEQPHHVPSLAAHDAAEIMGLRLIQRDKRTRTECTLHMQTRRG